MLTKLSARARSLGSRGPVAILACVFSLHANLVYAANVTSTWGASTNGVWNLDANWVSVPGPNLFPNNGNGGVGTFDAVINATGADYTVTLGTNITVEDLTLNSANATVNHTGGTFSATGAIGLTAGTYQLNGGTISTTAITIGGGALSIGANSSNLLTGVTLNGDLNLAPSGARTKIAGGTTFASAHLSGASSSLGFVPGQTLTVPIIFEGAAGSNRAVEMDGTAGAFTIGATGVIRNSAGIGSDAQIGGSFQYGGNMALTNQGLISSQVSGRTITINANTLTNAGGAIIEATSGGIVTINSSTWSNAGTIRSQTGSTVNLNGTWSNLGGTITAEATATLNFGGSFTTANLGTLTLPAGSTVNITGAWNNAGQSFTFNAATGSWILNAGTISGGSLNSAAGQSLLIGANSSNLLTGVTVNGDLNLVASGARTKIAGGTTFASAHLSGASSSLGFAPGQTLTVPIIFEGAAGSNRAVEMDGTAGDFTIGATGVIRNNAGVGSDAQIGGSFQYGGNMALTNQGLISSQVSGRTITINANTLTNAGGGIIEATSGGIVTINSSTWSNAGTIRSQTGSTVNLNGTWSNLGGTITADAASTLNLGGAFSTPNLGTLTLPAGSTVNITGSWNNAGQSFTFNAATGSWILNAGTVTGGSLNYAAGQSLLIGANSSNLLSGVTVNGDLNLVTSSARTKIAGGTTFASAHLSGASSSLGFAPGQTLTVPIIFEGAAGSNRAVEMDGTAGAFTISATGVIRNNVGIASDAQIGGSFQYGGNMALTNQGMISSQVGGRTITINANTLTNAGGAIMEAISGGILTINPSTWSNAGTIRSQTGSTVNLNGAWSNLGGTITADATSTLNFGGSFTTPNLGTLTLPAGSTVNITGSWNNAGQSFTFNAATGSWILNAGTISGGSLNYAAGQILLIGANSSNLLTGVAVNGDLNLTANGARTKIAGGTTFASAHLSGASSSLGFAPGQTLTVPVIFEGGAGSNRAVEMDGTAGAFTIGATGVIRNTVGIASDAQIGGSFQYGGNMALTNQGLISSQVGGRTITINASTLTNAGGGIIEATSGGIVTINSSTWSNVGTIRSQTGSTVNLNGTWSNLGGTITADATSTLNFGGSFTTPNLGTLTLPAGSTVNITGAWNNAGQSFTFNAATGSWILNAGTISGGSLNSAAGQSLLIGPSSSNLLTGVTANGDLNLVASGARTKIAGGTTFASAHLSGASSSLGFAPGQTLTAPIIFEGGAGSNRAVEMDGTAGELTIGATGVIRNNAGVGSDAQIGGSFQYGGNMALINQGLISSQVSGRTINIVATSFSNAGTVEAINGGVVSRPGGYIQSAGVTRVVGGTVRAQASPPANDLIQITGGGLEGNGSIIARVTTAGFIDPTFGPGGLVISDDLTVAATTEFRFSIGGLTAGTQFDLLTEAGTTALSLAGTLTLSLANGFLPAGTDTFTIILSNQPITGMFSNVVGGRVDATDGVSSFGVAVVGNSVVLNAFQTIPEPSAAALLAVAAGALGLRRRALARRGLNSRVVG